MTVSSTETPRKEYAGNGATTDFPIVFPYADEPSVIALHVAADGTETTWTQDGAGDTGYAITAGEVVANTPPALGADLVLYRDTEKTQGVDLVHNRATGAEIKEGAHDRIMLIAQELEEMLGRSIHITIGSSEGVSTELPGPDANKVLGWNSAANAIENKDAGTLVFSQIGYLLTDYDDLDDALTTIGAAASAELWLNKSDATNVTLTSNISLRPMKGFVQSGTVDWNQAEVVGYPQFQWLSGSGHTGLLWDRPEWWGIDGVSDEVEIQFAVDAVAANKGRVQLTATNTGSLVNDYTLTAAGITMAEEGVSLESTGGIVVLGTAADIDGLTLSSTRCLVRGIRMISTHATPTGFAFKLTGACSNNRLFYPEAYGFKYHFGFVGQGAGGSGVAYNEVYSPFSYGVLNDGYNIYIDDGGASWANENKIFGGRISNFTTGGPWGHLFYASAQTNNNAMIGVSFEDKNTTGFTAYDYGTNVFSTGCRFECNCYGIYVSNIQASQLRMSYVKSNHFMVKNFIGVAIGAGRVNTDYWGGGYATFQGYVTGANMATTTIDVESAAGQRAISIASLTDMYAGNMIVLDEGNAEEEWHVISGVHDGTGTFDFVDGDVSVGDDTIAETAHGRVTGAPVQLSTTGVLPTGLSAATTYYVIAETDDLIKLATTSANAAADTAIDITAAAGGGTHTLTDDPHMSLISNLNNTHEVAVTVKSDGTAYGFMYGPPPETTYKLFVDGRPRVVHDGSIERGASSFIGQVDGSNGGLRTLNRITDTDIPPTQAQLQSSMGVADGVLTGAGYIGTLDENEADTNNYLIWSNGTSYFYVEGTKAP